MISFVYELFWVQSSHSWANNSSPISTLDVVSLVTKSLHESIKNQTEYTERKKINY